MPERNSQKQESGSASLPINRRDYLRTVASATAAAALGGTALETMVEPAAADHAGLTIKGNYVRVAGGAVNLSQDGGWNGGDYEVNTKVRVVNNAAGIVFRAQDSDNLYMWQINTGKDGGPYLRPHVKENGSWTKPDNDISIPERSGPYYDVRIVANGDTITTYIDGTKEDERTDTTFSDGKVGVRHAGSNDEIGELDEIVVEDLNDGILWEDDFTDDLSQWATTEGMDIDHLLEVDGEGVHLSNDGGWNSGDYELNVKARVANKAAGIVFRAQDSDNLYMWQLNTSLSGGPYLRPHVKDGGSWTVLDEISIPQKSGRFYDVRIVADGTTITTYLDGTQEDQRTDSTHSNGKVGFREAVGNGEVGEFDDVVVEDLGGSVLFEDDFEGDLSKWNASSSAFSVVSFFDIKEMFGKSGMTEVRHVEDVDGDGEKELVINIGSQAHFAALKMDGTVVWENEINTTKTKHAYNAKVKSGVLYWGNRDNDTIYAVNLNDGSLKWSKTVSEGVGALEKMDIGIAYGDSGGVGVLDYADGSQKSGWPVTSIDQHEQSLGAGDLDGDGEHELVLNDNSGHMEVRNRDGSLKWQKTHDVSHLDRTVIGDINPNNSGNEVLVATDQDGDTGGEGDTITLYDANGNEVASYETATAGVSFAVADFHSNQDGLEIAYGIEGDQKLAMLDGTLSKMWETTMQDPESGALGQSITADIDGDGDLEYIANTDEDASGGFEAYDKDGNFIDAMDKHGWNQLAWTERKAKPEATRHYDIDDDGRDEIIPGLFGSNNTSSDETVFVLEYEG